MAKKQIEITKKDGRADLSCAEFIMSTMPNGEYIITIEKKTQKRSISQNALLWLWLTCIEKETGTPKQDAHDVVCANFLSHAVKIEGNEYVASRGTSGLNTEEFTELLDKIHAWAATDIGIELPYPEEKNFDIFVNQYGI